MSKPSPCNRGGLEHSVGPGREWPQEHETHTACILLMSRCPAVESTNNALRKANYPARSLKDGTTDAVKGLKVEQETKWDCEECEDDDGMTTEDSDDDDNDDDSYEQLDLDMNKSIAFFKRLFC
jgi:hypothetical protein